MIVADAVSRAATLSPSDVEDAILSTRRTIVSLANGRIHFGRANAETASPMPVVQISDGRAHFVELGLPPFR